MDEQACQPASKNRYDTDTGTHMLRWDRLELLAMNRRDSWPGTYTSRCRPCQHSISLAFHQPTPDLCPFTHNHIQISSENVGHIANVNKCKLISLAPFLTFTPLGGTCSWGRCCLQFQLLPTDKSANTGVSTASQGCNDFQNYIFAFLPGPRLAIG